MDKFRRKCQACGTKYNFTKKDIKTTTQYTQGQEIYDEQDEFRNEFKTLGFWGDKLQITETTFLRRFRAKKDLTRKTITCPICDEVEELESHGLPWGNICDEDFELISLNTRKNTRIV